MQLKTFCPTFSIILNHKAKFCFQPAKQDQLLAQTDRDVWFPNTINQKTEKFKDQAHQHAMDGKVKQSFLDLWPRPRCLGKTTKQWLKKTPVSS